MMPPVHPCGYVGRAAAWPNVRLKVCAPCLNSPSAKTPCRQTQPPSKRPGSLRTNMRRAMRVGLPTSDARKLTRLHSWTLLGASHLKPRARMDLFLTTPHVPSLFFSQDIVKVCSHCQPVTTAIPQFKIRTIPECVNGCSLFLPKPLPLTPRPANSRKSHRGIKDRPVKYNKTSDITKKDTPP